MEVEIGKKYRHFKGNIYEVVGIGKHSETCEDMVIYKSLKDGGLWCRPKSMWFETVRTGAIRFTKIDN